MKQQITGIIKAADSAEYDGTFVISSEVKDRDGDIIKVDGWEIENFKNNPIALWQHDKKNPVGTWHNFRTVGKDFIADLKLATTNLAKFAKKLIVEDVLRAVSVGFLPIDDEYEWIVDDAGKYTGVLYKRAELLEASLVSVPSNPRALRIAKSFDLSESETNLVFAPGAGQKSVVPEIISRAKAIIENGESADNQTSDHRERKTMTLSEKIKSRHDELSKLREALADAATKYAEDPTDENGETVEGFASKIESNEKELKILETAERNIMEAVREQPAPEPMPRAPGIVTNVKDYKPGELIFRQAAVKYIAHLQNTTIQSVIDDRYPRDKGLEEIRKAAVAPGDTTTSAWAAALLEEQVQGFIEQVSNNSIYGMVSGAGLVLNFSGKGSIKIPSETSSSQPSGAFVGEGNAIPVKKLDITSQTLARHKMAVIVPMTEELVDATNGQIETIVRRAIIRETSKVLDSVLLGAAAGSTIQPAGLLNGVTTTTSSGATAANIITDIKALIGGFATDDTDQDIRIIMNPLRKLGLITVTNAVGEFAFKQEVNAGNLMGYTLHISSNVPSDTVIAVNATDFATGYDGPEFSMSNTATLHMEDTAPDAIGTAGTPNVVAAPVRSLFQTDTVAIKMRLPVTWAMTRTSQVSGLDTVAW